MGILQTTSLELDLQILKLLSSKMNMSREQQKTKENSLIKLKLIARL